MLRSTYNIFISLSMSFAIGCLAGCGGGAASDVPELGDVSGVVTVDGEPVAGVTVLFTPVASTRPSRGTTDADGAYTLTYNSNQSGTATGINKISLELPEFADEGETLDPLISRITIDYTESFMEFDVQPGANDVDIPIEL